MKKVTSPISFDEFKLKADQNAIPEIEKLVDQCYNDLGDSRKWYTPWVLFGGIVSSPILIGIIFILLWYFTRKRVLEYLENNLSQAKIFDLVINNADENIKVLDVIDERVIDIRNWSLLAFKIPASEILNKSKEIHLSVYGNEVIAGSERYNVTKEVLDYQVSSKDREIGVLEFTLKDNNFNDLDFTLGIKKTPDMKLLTTENLEFNKKFMMHTNNDIKALMVATPLTTESWLKHFKNNIKSKDVRVIKLEETVAVIWRTYAHKSLEISYRISHNSGAY